MTRRTFTARAFTLAGSLAAALTLAAHGDAIHVKGTITKVNDSVLTVKGTDGKTLIVALDAKTEITKDKQPLQKTDIKAGMRVVIHAEKHDGKLVAESVELGSEAPATQK